ncbi:MAG: M23 family metallopeptidase [Clostridiales bacterium]|nr:M23 family metallopeptidase [Clostridiales bacterium]
MRVFYSTAVKDDMDAGLRKIRNTGKDCPNRINKLRREMDATIAGSLSIGTQLSGAENKLKNLMAQADALFRAMDALHNGFVAADKDVQKKNAELKYELKRKQGFWERLKLIPKLLPWAFLMLGQHPTPIEQIAALFGGTIGGALAGGGVVVPGGIATGAGGVVNTIGAAGGAGVVDTGQVKVVNLLDEKYGFYLPKKKDGSDNYIEDIGTWHDNWKKKAADFHHKDETATTGPLLPAIMDGKVVLNEQVQGRDVNGNPIGKSNNLVIMCEIDGRVVFIDYGHLAAKPDLKPGDTVKAGDLIAQMGKSGADNVHLHLEIRVMDKGYEYGGQYWKSDASNSSKNVDPIQFMKDPQSVISSLGR